MGQWTTKLCLKARKYRGVNEVRNMVLADAWWTYKKDVDCGVDIKSHSEQSLDVIIANNMFEKVIMLPPVPLTTAPNTSPLSVTHIKWTSTCCVCRSWLLKVSSIIWCKLISTVEAKFFSQIFLTEDRNKDFLDIPHGIERPLSRPCKANLWWFIVVGVIPKSSPRSYAHS